MNLKFLALAAVLVMILPLASATWEWDNVGTKYNEASQEITVTNALGLGRDLAKFKLVSPRVKSCNKPTCFVEYEVDMYENYSDIVSELETYNYDKAGDIIGDDVTVESWWSYYDDNAEREVWNEECIKDENGTSCKYVQGTELGDWVTFDNAANIPIGELKLRNYFVLGERQWIEYIPTFIGVRVDEWAVLGNDGFTTALLHFNHANGTTTFTESANGNNTAHVWNGWGGAVAVGDEVKFGSGALYCDGSSNANTTVSDLDADFNFGAGDNFTVDMWIYLTDSTTTRTPWDYGGVEGTGSSVLMTTATNQLRMLSAQPNAWDVEVFSGADAIPDNQWTHIAMERYGGNNTMYVNGTIVGSKVFNGAGHNGTDDFPNLCSSMTGNYFIGYIDEVRFSQVARYNLTNFDVETQEYGTAAEISVVYPTNTTYSTLTLDLNYTSPDGIDCWWYNGTDNSSSVVCGNNWTGLTALEGSNTWIVYANNSYNDIGSDSVTFTADTTEPAIAIVYPTNTTYTIGYAPSNSTTIGLNYTTSGAESCWYWNGTGASNTSITCGDNITFTQPFGGYTFWVYANDTVNNENSTSISATYDYSLFENGLTYDGIIYETDNSTFISNITWDDSTYSSISASLIFNGTIYSATETEEDLDTSLFTYTLDVPVVNFNETKNWFFSYNLGSTNINQTTNTTSVANTTLEFCTTGSVYVNFSFRDESDDSAITGEIDTSTWTYYLGGGTTTEGYSYINNSNYSYFEFCFTPGTETVYYDLDMDYSHTDYPQRSQAVSGGSLTSTITEQVLYLLASADGTYSTFQVLSAAGQPLSGVTATAQKTIGGTLTTVDSGTTGDDGAVTFWLDSDYSHTFTFSLAGYADEVITLTPTQSSYTVYMGATISGNNTYDFMRGIGINIVPTGYELTNGTYYIFNFSISSSYWSLTEYGFVMTNGTDTLGSASGSIATGGDVTLNMSTGGNGTILMNYYWNINGNYSNGTRTWGIQSEDYGFGLARFFEDLETYTDDEIFGLNPWSRTLLIFVLIFVVIGVVCYTSGVYSPAAISGMLFGLVFFFDIVLGLLPRPENALVGLPTILTLFFMVAMIYREATRG